jgi:hypothetical protein
MGDQPVARPLPTKDKANRINADIHASSGIRTHDLSVRATEGMKFNCIASNLAYYGRVRDVRDESIEEKV